MAWAGSSISSNSVTVALTAHMPETISVSLTAGSTVSFDLSQASPVAGSATPTWTTTWNLNPTNHAAVNTCVYFSSTTALTGGTFGNIISTSNILGQAEGTGTATAITTLACGETNALQINTYSITSLNRHNTTGSTDSVSLEINTSGLSLSADTYTGTLNIISYAP